MGDLRIATRGWDTREYQGTEPGAEVSRRHSTLDTIER
jgi:hypothetical protein